jgi:hypothetical protein
MALMFLHRPFAQGPHTDPKNQHNSNSTLDRQWRDWQAHSRTELMKITQKACEMFEEMREFGLFFLRGLVPWIGYTVYTAAGIMLYFYHFPEANDTERDIQQCRERVIAGCAFLKDMKNSWPMADSWVWILPLINV